MAKTKTREITLIESKGAFSIFNKNEKAGKQYDFEGVTVLRQLLNKEKARLLHIIKAENPQSMYELAKKLGRPFKAVNDDLKLLARMGFIELIEEKAKNRKRLRPVIVIDTLTIHLKI